MAIVWPHTPYYREIFRISGIFSEPFLMLGYQDISRKKIPKDFQYADFKQLLLSKGVKDVKTLDLFDPRSDLSYDLNCPVPKDEHQKYKVVFDIGTLEHVFDTKQCIENCLRMVKVDGLYVLHTAVNGYFGHGLHVFNPKALIAALGLNGFKIIYLKYSTGNGLPIEKPEQAVNVLIWIVAKKFKEIDNFKIPQQGDWYYVYNKDDRQKAPEKLERKSIQHTFIKNLIRFFIILLFNPIWKILCVVRSRLNKLLET